MCLLYGFKYVIYLFFKKRGSFMYMYCWYCICVIIYVFIMILIVSVFIKRVWIVLLGCKFVYFLYKCYSCGIGNIWGGICGFLLFVIVRK